MNILFRPGANFLQPIRSGTETTRFQNNFIITTNTQFTDSVTKPRRTTASDTLPDFLIRQCSPTSYDLGK
jgi:hypothetical protein